MQISGCRTFAAALMNLMWITFVAVHMAATVHFKNMYTPNADCSFIKLLDSSLTNVITSANVEVQALFTSCVCQIQMQSCCMQPNNRALLFEWVVRRPCAQRVPHHSNRLRARASAAHVQEDLAGPVRPACRGLAVQSAEALRRL